MTNWRDLDRTTREAHMNPRAAVGDAVVDAHLERYAERSALARRRMRGTYDVRFGDGAKCTFDLFAPKGAGPYPGFVFVHGGYWRALDKAEHHFVVEPAVLSGFAALVVNYDLCPDVTLDDIVEELREFMRFLARQAVTLDLRTDGLTIAGHSAGAHLTAMLLHDPGTDAAPPITWGSLVSGIYEPAAALDISVNTDIRLTPAMAARNNVLQRLPTTRPVLEVTVGANEPAAWIGQSLALHEALTTSGHSVHYQAIPHADHFTILDRPIVPPIRGPGAVG